MQSSVIDERVPSSASVGGSSQQNDDDSVKHSPETENPIIQKLTAKSTPNSSDHARSSGSEIEPDKLVENARKASAHRRALSFANPNYSSLLESKFRRGLTDDDLHNSKRSRHSDPMSHQTKQPDSDNDDLTSRTLTRDNVGLGLNDSDGGNSSDDYGSVHSDPSRRSSQRSEENCCIERKISYADHNVIAMENTVEDMTQPTEDSDASVKCRKNKADLVTSKPILKESKSKSSSGPNIIQSAANSIKYFIVPNYKYRSDEFRKLFKTVSTAERLILDYSCAYQREILVHGRMYLSHNFLCFHANIFRWETTLIIPFKEIIKISKERTAKVIPNAIQVTVKTGEKYFFTSFAMRDKAHMVAFRLWQSSLLDQHEAPADLWAWAQHGYHESDLTNVIASEKNEDFNEDKVSILTSSSNEQHDLPLNMCRVKSESVLMNRQMASISVPSVEHTIITSTKRRLSATESSDIRRLYVPKNRCRKPLTLDLTERNNNWKKEQLGICAGSLDTPGDEDTTESSYDNDDVEISCSCAAHEGKEMLNEVYPLSVDQMFILLFTESTFFRQFQNNRKVSNSISNEWHTDKTTGGKSRKLSYTVALNHTFGPKSCEVIEKQVCAQCSKTGKVYVVKCECQNIGVPYADSFYAVTTYCLSRISSNQCRLRLHGGVVYRTRCWGIVKSKHLKMECEQLGFEPTFDSKKAVQDFQDEGLSLDSIRRLSTPPRSPVRRSNIDLVHPLLPVEIQKLTKAILIIMCILLVLNFILFYNLWSFQANYEQKSLESSLNALNLVLEKSKEGPIDVLKLLNMEKIYHEHQKRRILDKVQIAADSVDQLEKILNNLKSHLSAARQSLSPKFDSVNHDNENTRVIHDAENQKCHDSQEVCDNIYDNNGREKFRGVRDD